MQFTCFSALPTEIRLQIWDEALHQETDRRLVLVRRHNRTIIPTKWIMSPFLIVNNESRERAKDFYSYVIDVYTIARTIGPFPGGGTLVPGEHTTPLFFPFAVCAISHNLLLNRLVAWNIFIGKIPPSAPRIIYAERVLIQDS